MAEVASMVVKIGADIKEFQKNMKRLKRNINNAFGRETIAASKKLATVMAGIGVSLVGVGLASVKAAADMEQTKVAFSTLLGSAKEANKLLGNLEQMAANTPFQFPELADASKRLLAFKFEAKDIPKILTAAGDAASGLGLGSEGVNRITLALGQMSAKGKISGEEMRQLSETGINAWQYLADSLEVDVPTAMEMARKGTITAGQGINTILTGMGKQFNGMMQDQSKTFWGLFSTLKDNIGLLSREIGEKLTKNFKLKERLQKLLVYVQAFAKSVKDLGLKKTISGLIPSGFKKALLGIGIAITSALIPAFASLGAAIYTSTAPLLPFMLAIAGLTYMAYELYDNWYSVSAFFQEAWVTILGTLKSVWSDIKILFINGTDWILSYVEKLGKFVPSLGDKVKSVRDQLSNIVDDEKTKKNMDKYKSQLDKLKIWKKESEEYRKKHNKGFSMDDLVNNMKESMNFIKPDTSSFNLNFNIPEIKEEIDNTINQIDGSLSTTSEKAKSKFGEISKSFGEALRDTITTGEDKIISFIDRLQETIKQAALEKYVLNPVMKKLGLEVPKLATGGITTGPTLAMIGEEPGVKEMVLPLKDSVLNKLGGSGEVNINVINNAPVDVETHKSSNGIDIVINTVKRGFNQGKFDDNMRAYGVSRKPGY